ncbi:hypothetical protein BD414DRAFT_497712 [Trametes punicea]|nr:hypothetical protein BD414DRAFT_497712 [Trametes punicea]
MTASPTPASAGSLLRIDDTSPQLQYSGQWVQGGTAQDYRNTSHTSSSAGSTVKLTFNGTYVTVYGSVDNNGSASTYQLDDAAPVTQSVQQVPSPQYNWPFFYPSSPLQSGLHELLITVKGGTFNLDYIDYIGFAPEDDAGDASLVQSPSSPSLSPSPSPSSSSDSSRPSIPSSRKGLPAGAIAGIAIAAAAALLGVAVALFYLRRRSARKVRHRSHIPEKGIDDLIDEVPPSEQETSRDVFRRLSRVYRPRPAKSGQSSKTATSSAPTSITQSSAMFTSVILLSPALSMVSEEAGQNAGTTT